MLTSPGSESEVGRVRMAELHLHSPIYVQVLVFQAQIHLYFHQGEFHTIHVISGNFLKELNKVVPKDSFELCHKSKLGTLGKAAVRNMD
jgi:hypothetical protein